MGKAMNGRRVLVTGAGTGIGREIALEFARQGAKVVLHYAHSNEGALSAVREIESGGGQAISLKADLREVEEAKRLASMAVDYLGGIDVLVNNAGITMTLEFEKITPEQFDTLYNVNVKSHFFLIQSVLPYMLQQQKGAIINLSSVHGIRGYIGHSVYAGTKGAIIAYSRELAVELAPHGIRVNVIAPGLIPVENHFKVLGTDDVTSQGKLLPCGFVGTPLDIAKTAVFLSSDDARYIIGQTIVVDGGTTSWMAFNTDYSQIGDLRLGQGYVPGI